MYTLVRTLNGHNDSITTTQFSPNGSHLGSGSEDGLLLIHSIGDWKCLLRFVDASPITSLVWHPSRKRVLFCGCKSGDVHMIRFSASGVRSRLVRTEHCTNGRAKPSRTSVRGQMKRRTKSSAWHTTKGRICSPLGVATMYS